MGTIAEIFVYSDWTEAPCAMSARYGVTVAYGTYFLAALLIYTLCYRRLAAIITMLLSRI